MTFYSRKPWLAQMTRYGLVGLVNNLRGYLIYLLITWLWLDPKLAVTLMYPIGAVIAYFGHSKYTFAFGGHTVHGIARYVFAHLIGYGVNVGILYFFSDLMGYPHQLVQIAAILMVAGILFILFRYYVFPDIRRPS